MNSGQPAHTPGFLAGLTDFQRRLRFAAFVRYLPITAAVIVIASEAAVLAARPTMAQASIGLAGGVALAVGTALVLALVGTPSLPATARTLDATFRLEDRVVTAIEFVGQPDAVSRLIVADAVAQLAAHTPKELPLQIPLGRRTWGLAALACTSLLIAIAIRGPMAPAENATGLSFKTGAADSSGGSQESPKATAQGSLAARASASAGAVSPQASRDESVSDARGRGAAAVPPGTTVPPAMPRSREDAPGEDRTGSPPGLPSQSSTGLGDRPETRSPAGPGSARALPAAGAPERGTGPGGRSGGGAERGGPGMATGGAAAAGPTTGAGGVKGIPVVGGDSAMPARPANPVDERARYRAARNRAESALAQERVPAGLRSLVRDYLSAIGSGEQP